MTDTSDPRINFLVEWTIRLLKLKPEKAAKLLNSDAIKPHLMDFLDKTDVERLIIVPVSGGQVTADTKFPSTSKGKVVHFTKKSPEIINKKNFRKQIIFGDLPASVIEFLAAFINEILIPIVNDEKNRTSWPSIVVTDLQRQVHEFKLLVEQVLGLMNGTPVLLPPEGLVDLDRAVEEVLQTGRIQDWEFVQYVENTVAMWNQIVEEIMESTSAEFVIDGEFQGALVELMFWKKRCQILERLNTQLESSSLKKVMIILEKIGSNYCCVLQKVQERVAKGNVEEFFKFGGVI